MSPRIVITIVVVIFVAVRLGTRVRRRGLGAGATRGTVRIPLALPRALGDAGLVAERELRVRLRGRIFRLGTLLVVGASVLAVVIPTLGGGGRPLQRVGVVGGLAAPLRAAVLHAGAGGEITVRLVPEPDRQAARAALRSGALALAIDDGRAVLTKQPIAANDTSTTARLARSLATTLGVDQALRAAHLTPRQAALLTHARALPLRSLTRGASQTARITSFVALELLLFMLFTYNSWILYGVMEEKSSRVVEVLLSTVRPLQLLAGKILGIGLLALTQAALIVIAALVAAKASGSSLAQGSAPEFLLACLIWLLLGYVFYCWVYAAVGSTAERRDQIMTLMVPISIPIVFGYIVALTAAGSGSAGTLVKVLAYLPPTAPFAMPTLVGLRVVSWWQFVISIVISVACTIALARLAAGLYQRAILRTGGRVRLRQLFASDAR